MITSLALPRRVIGLLQKKGFDTREEITEISPVELAKELSMTQSEALRIWNTARHGDDIKDANGEATVLGSKRARAGESAFGLLKKKALLRPIPTLCRQIDEILGGGVQPGDVTEVCGSPGVGKTQFGIQLACNVQIPIALAGTGGKAVYIDTEGSFVPRRARQIARGLQSHLRHCVRNHGPDMRNAADAFKPDAILANITIFRVYNYVEQIACVRNLASFLARNPEVKLVILDSVAFHFRHGFTNRMMQRTRLLTSMAQVLHQIAETHDLSVVIFNQMTTRVRSGGSASVVAALGPTWAHAITTRLVLETDNEGRMARIQKSPSLAMRSARYCVKTEGIRDENSMAAAPGSAGDRETAPRPTKRQRRGDSKS